MTTAAQAGVIGAGVLSVLVFPLVAVGLQQRKSTAIPHAGADGSNRPTEPPAPG